MAMKIGEVKTVSTLPIEIIQLKNRALKEGLYETAKILKEAEQKIGWEISKNERPNKNF